MTDIQELKTQTDIVSVAEDLGCLPPKNGRIYQGGQCPNGHDSKGNQCFTIYPDTQSAHCFSCGESWDVIALVEQIKGVGFIPACDWLCDKYSLPHLQTRDMTPEEKAEHDAKTKERRTVFDILTAAARFYHQILLDDDEIKFHLMGHYGLNEETIKTYALGYSKGTELFEHLRGLDYTERQIISTGLFVKVGSSWKEFFNHRIIFPYWKSGQVVYFSGRKTDRTPEHDGKRAKYKKLPLKKESQPYISEFISNKWFYGEDAIRRTDTVYIAEGVTDCLAMLQAGYPTFSPATTRLNADNLKRIEGLLRNMNTVYLTADNEDNRAGINGAMDTAEELEALGKSVYIVNLPRPEGVEKIDAADYLRDNSKDAFDHLISEAKTSIQIEIDEIAKENLDNIRLPDRLKHVKERLAKLPHDKRSGYFDYMKTALKVKIDFIQGVKKEVQSLVSSEENAGGLEGNETKPSALFPELVDLVLQDDQVRYLCKFDDGLHVKESFTDKSGNQLVPPGKVSIPFDLIRADSILKYQHDENGPLYWDILKKLKEIAVLPGDRYYHLCTIYIFFTYISEASAYYPYLWFYGLPERGKSRMVKAIINLSYRGFYTETLNEAYIFRFADLFRGTLALDLYEISERAQKKGSQDLLLGRFEQGMKVPRVIAPDKGAFRDTVYFTVSGPTIIATNKEIPGKDPLQSRCIKITMPEARGIYSNNNCFNDLVDLKGRLLAFRTRHLGQALPAVDKPIAGRLGDIIHPLLCTAKLLPPEASDNLLGLIADFETERRDAEAESLAGRIAEALHELQCDVENGRLPVEKVRDKINEGIDERFQIAPQTIGRELSAMGIERKKSEGKMHIIFNEKVIKKIWERFLLRDNLPNLPNLPNSSGACVLDGEIEKANLPNLPENREEREIPKTNLPAGNVCKTKEREEREEREISPEGVGKRIIDNLENTGSVGFTEAPAEVVI